MATLNLSDPGVITSVYSSVIENVNNWLLLHYIDESVNEIGLHSFGKEGLEELKNKIYDLNEVFIAFYREEIDSDPGYIIINYIPPPISGVKRARALVHSRSVGTIFKKHQRVLTVDSLSHLTIDNIHQAIANNITSPPSSPVATGIDTSPFEDAKQQLDTTGDLPADLVADLPSPISPVRSSSPDIGGPMVGRKPNVLGGIGQHTFRTKAFLAGLFKGIKKSKAIPNSLPPPIPPKVPPIPPKDEDLLFRNIPPSHFQPSAQPARVSQGRTIRYRRSRSLSDFAEITHSDTEDNTTAELNSRRLHSQFTTLPLKGKWAQETAFLGDPGERARRRRELQLKREQEEREAIEEEQRRQRRIKMEQEDLLKQEAEEQRKRKDDIESEIRRKREEKKRREAMERDEEERKQRELEERKRQNRDRRMEEHRKLEQWREEQARRAEIAAQRAEETRRWQELERTKRIQEVASKLRGTKQESDLTGWITMLNKESLAWKRRYYKFVGNTISLYRDKEDLSLPLNQLDLQGKIEALKEWNEGYEDLEAISFSFVVEFKGENDSWSIYADSEEEKFKVLGLFKVAGGL